MCARPGLLEDALAHPPCLWSLFVQLILNVVKENVNYFSEIKSCLWVEWLGSWM